MPPDALLRPCGLSSLADQFSLELGEGSEYGENHPAFRPRRVRRRALPRQHLQPDFARLQILNEPDQVDQRPTEAVELPDHERVADLALRERRCESLPAVQRSRGLVLMDKTRRLSLREPVSEGRDSARLPRRARNRFDTGILQHPFARFQPHRINGLDRC